MMSCSSTIAKFQSTLCAVGEAALVDEPPASEVGRRAAAAGAEVKTAKAA
jgi:hypothetical protein